MRTIYTKDEYTRFSSEEFDDLILEVELRESKEIERIYIISEYDEGLSPFSYLVSYSLREENIIVSLSGKLGEEYSLYSPIDIESFSFYPIIIRNGNIISISLLSI